MSSFFTCLVFLLSGIALLQSDKTWCRKLARFLFWLASGLGAYALTHSASAALLVLLSWIVFPFLEVFFLLRQFRIARQRTLTDTRAFRDDFEELDEITGELNALGFSLVDECRMRPAVEEQYFRLFLHEAGRIVSTVSYVSEGALRFHFVAFSCVTKEGGVWTTWDYPLTYGLKMPDRLRIYRVLDAGSLPEMIDLHREFLEINGVAQESLEVFPPAAPAIRSMLQQVLDEQVQYNIDCGNLSPDLRKEGAGLRYSWKGTFFVAREILRDLLF